MRYRAGLPGAIEALAAELQPPAGAQDRQRVHAVLVGCGAGLPTANTFSPLSEGACKWRGSGLQAAWKWLVSGLHGAAAPVLGAYRAYGHLQPHVTHLPILEGKWVILTALSVVFTC